MLLLLVGFALLGLAAGTFALIGFFCLRRERRAAAVLRARALRLASRIGLLESTLENIGEGLAVFDRDGRLVAWNSRMIELLDLSEKIGPEATLREILMLQALRGDFGEVDPENEVGERLERFYREVPSVKERVTA